MEWNEIWQLFSRVSGNNFLRAEVPMYHVCPDPKNCKTTHINCTGGITKCFAIIILVKVTLKE